MNKFRTSFEIADFSPKINYNSTGIFIGSCFTENIGNYLKAHKFKVMVNPTGIIYNPVSVSNCINFILSGKQFEEKDLGFNNDLWLSLQHHGSFSAPDKTKCLDNINKELRNASSFINNADFLFITFGTAYIYTHKEKNEVVANCHKFPGNMFLKTLLTPEIIVSNYKELLRQLRKINPGIKIIFTVSPVRHWKDGAMQNQISKSVLFVAINEIIKNADDCYYFPAYEIMMDDLRDYRFYAEDMIHPGVTAIEYIRDKFVRSFIDKDSCETMNEIGKLILAKNHRPFNTETASHKKFITKYFQRIQTLKKQFPFLDLEEFEEYFIPDNSNY